MFCPSCGELVTENQRFCAHCGTELRQAQPVVALGSVANNLLIPAPDQDAILIGRDPALRDTAHCYLDHPAISSQHARIERRGDQWFVVDLYSSKGTFVNYQRVPPGPIGQPVTEEDTIWVAPYAFHLRTTGPRSELHSAHMRLDAHGLHSQVKVGRDTVTILDLRATPLSFSPGEFVALVGGSGSGKTTLMKALNGMAPAQEGQVAIDGRAIIEGRNAHAFAALFSIMGYVPQDDVMHRDLTVTELLRYVARLRLADLTAAEIATAVDEALAAVDLSPHAGKLIRHLSGGQRKRVNIAMELLARPRLLFLDEPISGLDPGLDLEIMTLLRNWARGTSEAGVDGRSDPKTIVLVTHATENIEQCDYIAFMEPGGRLAYFGPPRDAKRFFVPEREPDDVTYSEIYRRVAGPPPAAQGRDGGQQATWADAYRESTNFERYIVARQPAEIEGYARPVAALEPVAPVRINLPTRPELQVGLQQFRILVGRYARLIGRDKLNAAFLFLQAPLVALLLAAVSSPQALRPAGALDAEKVLFILACAAVWLGVINSTKVIVAEQDIYQRERLYGLGPAPYVLSKITVLGGIGLLQMALLVFFMNLAILLPDRGLVGPVQLEYFVTLVLSTVAGMALGLLTSALARTLDLANTLMFLLLIVQVIFSGLLFEPVGLAQIPASLTISRWALQALGTSTDLNRLLTGVMPGYDWNPAYRADLVHLLACWLILVLYAAICIGLACWRQARK
ncbi:MAG: hypothetical protein CVU38_06575 [Chloroflexi bacterium HGW-Chloroflexi-1]|nr:MAG: hypothetical protein CVU38_06575 [Chloroflexi bacterium HGW-Chloroflexi-1]